MNCLLKAPAMSLGLMCVLFLNVMELLSCCVVVVVVVCLSRPMEGIGRLLFSDLFFTELPVPPQAAGVVGTFNVLDIYPSEHYGLSFFGVYGCPFFTRSFFLYISILQVHFACVLLWWSFVWALVVNIRYYRI